MTLVFLLSLIDLIFEEPSFLLYHLERKGDIQGRQTNLLICQFSTSNHSLIILLSVY